MLEEEMSRFGASIHRLTDQEKRLIRLYGMGHVTEDYLSTEAGLVRKARADKEAEAIPTAPATGAHSRPRWLG